MQSGKDEAKRPNRTVRPNHESRAPDSPDRRRRSSDELGFEGAKRAGYSQPAWDEYVDEYDAGERAGRTGQRPADEKGAVPPRGGQLDADGNPIRDDA